MNDSIEALNDRLAKIREGDIDETTAAYWNQGGELILSMVQDEIERITVRPIKVLDVGCGGGSMIVQLAERDTMACGVDPLMEVSLVKARSLAEQKGKEIGLVQAKGELLPFRTDYFDVVICASTLQHVEDQRAVLKEISRVMKPGGSLIVTVPTYRNVSTLFLWKKAPGYVTKVYDFPSFMREIEGAGFRAKQVETFGFFPPFSIPVLNRISKVFGKEVMSRFLAIGFSLGRAMPKTASTIMVTAVRDLSHLERD